MQLPPKIKEILNIFKKQNIDAYVVGGALRDLILGRKPSDFDIATPASPQVVQDLFQDYRLVLIGIKHGTIGVFFKTIYVEITTFRKEEDYQDHRHPEKITFIHDLQTDLSRRDFTINALAYNNKLFDYFNGLQDLSQKVIRTVGNPFLRFEEDGLRILRALRFASTLSFTIEADTRQAIFARKELILFSAYERINTEFSKLLIGVGIYQVLLDFYSVLAVFIPRISEVIQHRKDAKKLALVVASMEATLVSRLAAFYFLVAGDDFDFVFSDLQRLRYSKKNCYQVKDIIFLVNHIDHIDTLQIKKMLKVYHKSAILTAVAIKELVSDEDLSVLKVKIVEISSQCNDLKQMKVKGDDLIDLGITNTQEIKEILEYLLNEIMEERLTNDKDLLIQKVKEIKKN
ncbi:MAG: hypothetical protein PHF85_01240 [Bacilli bacterium]|nr:hypothetical protein [Bacilli bacterium]